MFELAVLVEVANVFVTLFLCVLAYFIFVDARRFGYRVDYAYFLVAAFGFILFDLAYLFLGGQDLVSSLRYFVKSSFLALVLLVFMLKSYLLRPKVDKRGGRVRSVLVKR